MKLTYRITLTALIAALALPIAAHAAKGERKKKDKDAPAATFGTVDKNADESISESEFVAANEKLGPDAAKARFGQLDKDHDGKLSKDEFAADSTGEKKRRRKKDKNV